MVYDKWSGNIANMSHTVLIDFPDLMAHNDGQEIKAFSR